MKSNKTIYFVATPIGNLSDLSARAIEILRGAQTIYCEDTRVTRKLIERLEIDAPLLTIHQHSTTSELEQAVKSIHDGEYIAYVSDAGSPNISDPGGILAELAYNQGIDVKGIPGPSAATLALSICGFPANIFTFLGFPPTKKGRNTYFKKMDSIDHAVVFYESKHRIMKTLAALPKERYCFVGRELTKMHEDSYRGTVEQVMDMIPESAKGEFVIVLAPKKYEQK